MIGRKATIAILGAVALLGIAVAIPTSLISLIITIAAVVGIVAVLVTSVLR